MERGAIGEYDVRVVGGERVNAFIPDPLPPDPPLELDGEFLQSMEAASFALGGLNAASALIPDKSLFIYAYVRKEAVLSSQIEGSRSSLADLLLAELDEAPGVPVDDITEVSNYVAALEHGLTRMRSGFPLSNRLVREMHGILLSSGRGSLLHPGEFRASQNWIGGRRPGDADFVPPPPHAVAGCMGELEEFIHATNDGMPTLLKAGLAHLQFETIHPFLDGNGRVGRLLIAMMLCHAGALQEPLLYLSLFFKQHRSVYYQLLDRVRRNGDWERWLSFFLDGVRETAEGAVAASLRLTQLFESDRARIQQTGRRAISALQVYQELRLHPILSLSDASERTGLTFRTAAATMELLIELGIAREITGQRRNRFFAYDEYLSILSEGTEPI